MVLETFFGDEGKDADAQWCCQRTIKQGGRPLVARFSEESQAIALSLMAVSVASLFMNCRNCLLLHVFIRLLQH